MVRRLGDARDRFFEKRFGMFVHWGLYAIPAWHEQVLWRSDYRRSDYEKLVDEFDPVDFDPDRWIDTAEAAGMEYLCFTTKHHDGFCMWDTAQTDYRITATPYGKDVLAMLAEACERRGMLLSLYYSLPDWHHPNYPNLGRHHEMFGPRPGDEPDEARYLAYVREQLRELLTGYGPIHQFFWDVNVAGFHAPELNAMIRELQPQALINDRGPDTGDYSTPERHLPAGLEFDRPTEACQSMGRESWGYREDEDYFSDRFLMGSIDAILAMGGNYLLNVGPQPNGELPRVCVDGLARIGDWYGRVREAFDDTVPCSSMLDTSESHRRRYDELFMTRRGNTFYVHAPRGLSAGGMTVSAFRAEPESATLLNDGRELSWAVDTLPWRWQELPGLRVRDLPVNELAGEPLVVKLAFGDDVAD